MDPYRANYLRLRIDYSLRPEIDPEERARTLETIQRALDAQPHERRRGVEMVLLRGLRKFGKKTELLARLSEMELDPRAHKDAELVDFRAKVYAEVEGKLQDAIRVLQSFAGTRRNDTMAMRLIHYLCFVGRYDEAQTFLGEAAEFNTHKFCNELQIDIDTARGNYDRALHLLRAVKQDEVFPAGRVVEETHLLLLLGRNPEAESAARVVLEDANYSPKLAALIINLEIARQRQGHKVDKPRLIRVIDANLKEDDVCLCAQFLMDDKDKAADRLRDLVESNRAYAYRMREWTIFTPPAARNWVRTVLSSRGLGVSELHSNDAKVAGART